MEGPHAEPVQSLESLAAYPIPEGKPIAQYTPQEREARIAQLLLKATVR